VPMGGAMGAPRRNKSVEPLAARRGAAAARDPLRRVALRRKLVIVGELLVLGDLTDGAEYDPPRAIEVHDAGGAVRLRRHPGGQTQNSKPAAVSRAG